MVRILLLTSTVGFSGSRCWEKLLAAQMIALFFLVVFLFHSPYRRGIHHKLQAVVMVMPVLSTGYGLSGGIESAASALGAGIADPGGSDDSGYHGDDDRTQASLYDSGGFLVAFHFLLALLPLLSVLSTLVATAVFLGRIRKKQKVTAPASPPRSSVGLDEDSWSSWTSMTDDAEVGAADAPAELPSISTAATAAAPAAATVVAADRGAAGDKQAELIAEQAAEIEKLQMQLKAQASSGNKTPSTTKVQSARHSGKSKKSKRHRHHHNKKSHKKRKRKTKAQSKRKTSLAERLEEYKLRQLQRANAAGDVDAEAEDQRETPRMTLPRAAWTVKDRIHFINALRVRPQEPSAESNS